MEDQQWKKLHLLLKGKKEGKEITVFDGEVEVPEHWEDQTIRTACVQYLRTKNGVRETSFKQVFKRIVETITDWGMEDGYFDHEDAAKFQIALDDALFKQKVAFNSPVFYNLGIKESPQISACFILGTGDSMVEIANTQTQELKIYQGGSGAGCNYSGLRSSIEPLSSGGVSSGPIPFIKGTDTYAKAVKSGGAHRRAAKMCILNIDHPDIVTFIDMKALEELKAQALIAAGYDADIDGEAYRTVAYQDMNVSVRVSNAFMRACNKEEKWGLTSRLTGEVLKTIPAPELLDKLVTAIDNCGDPGIQFDDKVNQYNTLAEDGRINASNPCGEYLSLDDTSCNLASINLLKFLDSGKNFDVEDFQKTVDLLITAQDILVDNAFYPNEKITENAKKYAQLGLGYANLGGLLSNMLLAYNSFEGRKMASLITSIMTGQAYLTSAKLAAKRGPFEAYERNKEAMRNVLHLHKDNTQNLSGHTLKEKALTIWHEVLDQVDDCGFRNSAVTLLAPTGTISFLMGCWTTGVEPEITLSKTKTFVDGRQEHTVSPIVTQLLEDLGYKTRMGDIDFKEMLSDITDTGWSDVIKQKDIPLFLTSLGDIDGNNSFSHKDHILMMAAVQPFLSMGISKTINLPDSATKADIYETIWMSYKEGLKSITIYKNGSKFVQPVTIGKKGKSGEPAKVGPVLPEPIKVPMVIPAIIHKFRIGAFKGRFTIGFHPKTRRVLEVYLKGSKQGSTIAGMMDAWAITFSKGLRNHTSLDELINAQKHTQFNPSGLTSNPKIRMCSSIIDYVVKFLEMECSRKIADAMSEIHREEVYPRIKEVLVVLDSENKEKEDVQDVVVVENSAPTCDNCGEILMRKGKNCYLCNNCGEQGGVCG